MLKSVIAVAVLVLFGGPAFAMDEYYIVRGPDKRCAVVEQRPTTTTIIVGDEDGYDIREEAIAEMRRLCRPKTNNDDDDND